jgi:hypothetical protein
VTNDEADAFEFQRMAEQSVGLSDLERVREWGSEQASVFAGAWLDCSPGATAGCVTVGLVGAPEGAHAALQKLVQYPDRLKIVPMRWSSRELETVAERIARFELDRQNEVGAQVTVVSVIDVENVVEVCTSSCDTAALDDRLRSTYGPDLVRVRGGVRPRLTPPRVRSSH